MKPKPRRSRRVAAAELVGVGAGWPGALRREGGRERERVETQARETGLSGGEGRGGERGRGTGGGTWEGPRVNGEHGDEADGADGAGEVEHEGRDARLEEAHVGLPMHSTGDV